MIRLGAVLKQDFSRLGKGVLGRIREHVTDVATDQSLDSNEKRDEVRRRLKREFGGKGLSSFLVNMAIEEMFREVMGR